MADKSSFTPDEWKLLLESMMMASIAITAAEPHGLWGLLKESFAGGTELAKAKMAPGSNALINAVVADFGTAEGRSVARDGLKDKFTGSKPADIKAKCIETLRQVGALVDSKAPGDAAAFKGWLRQISQHVAEQPKRADFWELEALPSVRPTKQRSPKFQAPSICQSERAAERIHVIAWPAPIRFDKQIRRFASDFPGARSALG